MNDLQSHEELEQAMREVIVKAMSVEGVSRRKLARVTGLSQPSVSRYISGHKDINARTWARMAEALGIDVSQFAVTKQPSLRKKKPR